MDWIVKAPRAGLGWLVLTAAVGCGGGGATVPTVTFRPEAVEELKPAADAEAAPADEPAPAEKSADE